MIKVEFNGQSNFYPKPIYFNDLKVNESYRIKHGGKGAVYIKVLDDNLNRFKQLEVVSGKVFNPTPSEVERVDLCVRIEGRCPQIYNNLPNVTEDIPF